MSHPLPNVVPGNTLSSTDHLSLLFVFLFSRLVKRSPNVQNLALRLFGKTLLQHNLHLINNSTKQLESSRESGSADEVFLMKASYPPIDHWSCFEHLSRIVTTHKDELSVKILKYLKALSKLAAPNLKEALFIKVFLPFLLAYKDMNRTNTLNKICRKETINIVNPYDSGYGTPTEGDVAKTGKTGISTRDGQESNVSEEALKICLTAIFILLEKEALRSRFMKLGGVSCVVNFLGDESLHRIILGILKLLATHVEDGSTSSNEGPEQKENLSVDTSAKSDGKAEVVNVLLRSMLLLDPKQENSQIDSQISEFAQKIRVSLHLPKFSQLLCQLWRCCFRILKRNVFFRERFVKSGGHTCVVTVLQVVKECLYKAKSRCDMNLKNQVVPCVMLMECAMAVGLEFGEEQVDGVQVILICLVDFSSQRSCHDYHILLMQCCYGRKPQLN